LRRNVFVVVLLALGAGACRQDMHDTPRYESYEASAFYADGRASRVAPTGTVARGWLREDEALYTGRANGELVAEFPFALSQADLQRGRERYGIYCTPCHGASGKGDGPVAKKFVPTPADISATGHGSHHPEGELFAVVTHGKNGMPPFRSDLTAKERWLVIAYLRTLK